MASQQVRRIDLYIHIYTDLYHTIYLHIHIYIYVDIYILQTQICTSYTEGEIRWTRYRVERGKKVALSLLRPFNANVMLSV